VVYDVITNSSDVPNWGGASGDKATISAACAAFFIQLSMYSMKNTKVGSCW